MREIIAIWHCDSCHHEHKSIGHEYGSSPIPHHWYELRNGVGISAGRGVYCSMRCLLIGLRKWELYYWEWARRRALWESVPAKKGKFYVPRGQVSPSPYRLLDEGQAE